jgi:hypothetical protein
MCMKYFDHISSPFTHFFPTPLPTISHPQIVPIFYTHVIHFFRPRFCIWERICNVCPSQSGLSHLTWWSHVPSVFLQMTCFHSSYGWIISIVYMCHIFIIHSSLGGHQSWFIHFTIINVYYVLEQLCCLIFYISCVSTLGFVHLRPRYWLEILIFCSLSVQIFSMFRQDRLRCYFSPLGLVYGSVVKHLSHARGISPDPQHWLDLSKLAGVSCRRVSCLVLGCFPYRSCFSLFTGSHCWLQEVLQPLGQASSHFLHKHPSLPNASLSSIKASATTLQSKITAFIFQKRQVNHKEVKSLARNSSVTKRQNKNLNLTLLTPKSLHLTLLHYELEGRACMVLLLLILPLFLFLLQT